MASLSLRYISKEPLFSVLDVEEQHSHLGWTQSFLREVKSKRPRELMAQACLVANMNRKAGNIVTSFPTTIDPKENKCYTRRKKKINAKEALSPEKLDKWMRDSITEIVKDIGKAPFLANVYTEDGIGSSPIIRLQLEREKAVTESWPLVKKRWERGGPIPDGVILVEELKDEENGEKPGNGEQHSTTRTWGILIQGRGVTPVACYILKTCRASSSIGFCTHFCLVRAKCFGEAAEVQVKNSWL